MVLLETHDDAGDRLYAHVGVLTAASREKAEECLLDPAAQLEEGALAERIPLDAGEEGRLWLVPRSAWVGSIPVTARQAILVVRA